LARGAPVRRRSRDQLADSSRSRGSAGCAGRTDVKPRGALDVPDPDVGQRDKLVAALGAVVSSVDELDKVIPLLEQLGRDHRRFAAVTAHYDVVGASLLATLKKFPRTFVDP
jgi:hypothetical protein